MYRLVLVLVLGVTALVLTALPTLATLNGCAAAKKLCVAKKAAAILKCHAKQEKPPGISAAKFADCVQTARDKFDGGSVPARGCFARAQAKFPGGCLTTDDTTDLEETVDAFVDDVVCKLDPGSGACPVTPTPTPTSTKTPTPGPTPTGCQGPGQTCASDPVCCSHNCNLLLGMCV